MQKNADVKQWPQWYSSIHLFFLVLLLFAFCFAPFLIVDTTYLERAETQKLIKAQPSFSTECQVV